MILPWPFAPLNVSWIAPSVGSIASNLLVDELAWRNLETHVDSMASIRLWEPTDIGVVLGRGSRSEAEVILETCQSHAISIHHRLSGGATVVLAPGCLIFTLTLPLLPIQGLHPIEPIHDFILDRFVAAFRDLSVPVQRAGTSDLTFETAEKELKKFSGNSLRVGRRAVLYHGTLLYAMDLSLLPRILKHPPREPSYRESRNHAAFVANLPLSREDILQRIQRSWE